ncbi:uncharacterized protein LOC126907191 [Daktulosphaira vitifoliae]|uniref:uncharacterized protein LOC126907191 n=1 Tax=Daktulosphaira vitifoliae TaxID=58002 RepID=UPI0021AAD188|nr:uncharacterized protein LOC126907191 [Daktulosphaira vitifoliae]
MYQLEQQILERFPSEKLEYYRTSKRGKIYNKYYNLATSFKVVSGPLGTADKKSPVNSEKFSRHSKCSEPEVDSENYIKILKYDNLSNEEFDRTWQACFNSRLDFIKKYTTKDIFDKWPAYKTANGYRLIDMDFEAAFEKKGDLLENWEKNISKLLLFLSFNSNVKDKNVRKLIEIIRMNNQISENGRDAAIIWALHGYFVPTNKLVKIDPKTKQKTTIKFTIRDSQESVIFVGSTIQMVEDHIENLKKSKKSIQPTIFCIGENITSINEIFLYLDGVRYIFKSIIKALDICFKSIYLFDFKFPDESVIFYSFLEYFFYDFIDKLSFPKVHVLEQYLNN